MSQRQPKRDMYGLPLSDDDEREVDDSEYEDFEYANGEEEGAPHMAQQQPPSDFEDEGALSRRVGRRTSRRRRVAALAYHPHGSLDSNGGHHAASATPQTLLHQQASGRQGRSSSSYRNGCAHSYKIS